jgi:RHS repeat-associated protein
VTERVVDFEVPGASLSFARFYNSASPYKVAKSPLGQDWSHTFAKAIKVTSIAVGMKAYVIRPTGSAYTFTKLPDGSWIPEPDVKLRLAEVHASGGSHIGWEVHETDDSIERYSLNGELSSIHWPDGRAISLQYQTGKLVDVTDERGRRLQFQYSGNALIAVVLPDGGQLEYGYAPVTTGSTDSRLAQVDFRPFGENAGKVTSYGYQAFNGRYFLAAAYDANDVQVSSWSYDSTGRGVRVARGDASSLIDRVTLSYGSSDVTVTDALGRSVAHEFVTAHSRRKLSGTSGRCAGCGGNGFSARSYDANGYPESTTALDGTLSTTVYEARGLLQERVEAVGTASQRKTITTWSAETRTPLQVTVLNAANDVVATTSWARNARGQATSMSILDAQSSRTTSFTYCEDQDVLNGLCPIAGLLISVDGPRAGTTDLSTFEYRAADHSSCASASTGCPYRKGDLWKTINALGQAVEILAYDGAGRVLSSKDPNGVVTDREYHPRGWLLAAKMRGSNSASEADDVITRYDYWATGLVKKITSPDGVDTRFEYDAAHRLTVIEDGAGNRVEYTLDNSGNRIAENIKGSGGVLKRTLSRVYNTLGQLATQADAQANPTDFTYDAVGNAKTVTDALGHVTSNDYDPLNRLKRTLQDVGGIEAETKFEYDANDNLTKVTDPKGLDTTYTYNGFGDQVQLSSPDTGITTFTYDSAGNRASQTDARGITTTYQYDALNRLTQVGYPTSSLNVSYTYDVTQPVCQAGETFSVGRLTLMVDGSGSTQYCHDRFGQLVRKVQTTNGVALTLQYAYTKGGQLQAMTYPDGTVVDYLRNAQGQITEVGVAQPSQAREVLLTQATYHPFGPIAGWVYGNGRVMQRNVDLDYRPTSIQGGPGGLDLTYGYDAVGNLTSLSSGSPPPLEYGYDALGRLTESRDGPTQAMIDQYTYDKTGNRTSFTDSLGTKAYAYPSTSHRLSSVAGEARTYDAVGNTLSIGTERAFDYSDAGRMSAVSNGGVIEMQYVYSGRGEQVLRQMGSTNTYTLYDEAGHWVGDHTDSAPVQQILWIDDMPVGVLDGGQLFYIQPDHLGSPRSVVEPDQDVAVWAWHSKGEVFGDSLPDQDQDGDGIPFNLSMRFPGQRYDAASGLNQNGARDYNAGGGRYVESDPIGLRGGMSTYGYVGGDPLHFIDPLGLLRWTNQGTTTMHNFDPSNPPAPSPFYSGGNVPENAGATVSADWKIRPKCVPRGGVFVLEEYEVDFQTFIHLMPSYPSQRLASWAVRAERDHITDYDNWASGRGQGTAQAVEDKIRTLTFDSLCECEQTADATMHNNLGPSFDKVIQETRAKHDATGRHLWGGPNARK